MRGPRRAGLDTKPNDCTPFETNAALPWFMRTACLVIWLMCLSASAARAQPEPPSADPGRREPTRLYFGMWTTHLKHDGVSLQNNWVVGLTFRGFFGGTFLNSYGRRAFTAGIQRTILSAEPRPIGASLGYRLGVVSGYDGRFMAIARETPVLPFVQPFVMIDVNRVGVEIQYTFVIVSVAASVKF